MKHDKENFGFSDSNLNKTTFSSVHEVYYKYYENKSNNNKLELTTGILDINRISPSLNDYIGSLLVCK